MYCHLLKVTINGFWIGWLDLLTPNALVTTLYKSLYDSLCLHFSIIFHCRLKRLPQLFLNYPPQLIPPQLTQVLNQLLHWTASTDCSAICPQDNFSVRTTQKTQPLYCWEGVFSAPLHCNGCGADHTDSIVLLLYVCVHFCGNLFTAVA
jgi:hypothetical protein